MYKFQHYCTYFCYCFLFSGLEAICHANLGEYVLCIGYSKTKSDKAMAKAQQSVDSVATCSEEESTISLTDTTSGVESFVEVSMQTNLHVSHPSTYISSQHSVSTREIQLKTDLCEIQMNISESLTQTDIRYKSPTT